MSYSYIYHFYTRSKQPGLVILMTYIKHFQDEERRRKNYSLSE